MQNPEYMLIKRKIQNRQNLEHLLSMVKQVPLASAHDAFRPAMEALAAIELLRHPDIDVKVSVASCISEIMRITAPYQPCDDAHLRQIQLIQPSLSKLEVRLISSLSYNKVVLLCS